MKGNLFGRNATPKAGSSKTATTSGKKPMEKAKPNLKPNALTLFVPKVFQPGNSVLLMSAKHRGDMYHFRAALQVKDLSVILHESNYADGTKELEDYLAELVLRNKKHILIVPWGFNVSSGKASLPSPIKYSLDGQVYEQEQNTFELVPLDTFSENLSTELIASVPAEDLHKIINGMTILGESTANELPNFDELSEQLSKQFPEVTKGFKDLWTDWIKKKKVTGRNRILLMDRDTGTRDPDEGKSMGVYPELDNGHATNDIKNLIAEIADKENKRRN